MPNEGIRRVLDNYSNFFHPHMRLNMRSFYQLLTISSIGYCCKTCIVYVVLLILYNSVKLLAPVFIMWFIMTSWHGLVFRSTGPLWGEPTGHCKGPVMPGLWCFHDVSRPDGVTRVCLGSTTFGNVFQFSALRKIGWKDINANKHLYFFTEIQHVRSW